MLANRPPRGREDTYGEYGKRRGARVSRQSMGRLRALAYLALLFALLPAAAWIATGRAGVPALFSTACGVVSCVAGDGAL